MQRLAYICAGTSRLFRVAGVNYLKSDKSLFEKENSLFNTNNLIFKRCVSNKNNYSKDGNNVDTHPDLYKPSTAAQETHVSDSLKGGQPTDTIGTASKNTVLGGGKVWSPKNPDAVHVAPLNRTSSTTFVSTPAESGAKAHETTVYKTRGEVNIADPFKTHTLQPEATPAQLAEAAAASAFEPFAPDTPLVSSPKTETVFAPKISSSDVYSTTSSPTADFDSTVPTSKSEPVKYETTQQSKVFGGQDTLATSKKHSKEDPFNM